MGAYVRRNDLARTPRQLGHAFNVYFLFLVLSDIFYVELL